MLGRPCLVFSTLNKYTCEYFIYLDSDFCVLVQEFNHMDADSICIWGFTSLGPDSVGIYEDFAPLDPDFACIYEDSTRLDPDSLCIYKDSISLGPDSVGITSISRERDGTRDSLRPVGNKSRRY